MAEKIPLVSVIIPVYNAAKFLPQTFESLLCQTMTDFEVVAADDCSTDNSVEV
ncbi:MAG: glycosyltransferase, partial [Selenomonadaceae bacterium]|nr:glycosyltransferase [Selenomonadaceae bacterium]